LELLAAIGVTQLNVAALRELEVGTGELGLACVDERFGGVPGNGATRLGPKTLESSSQLGPTVVGERDDAGEITSALAGLDLEGHAVKRGWATRVEALVEDPSVT